MAEKKRSGCRGCLLWMLGIFGLILLAIGVAGYLGYRKLVSLRDQYTQPQPLVLPSVRYSKDDLDGVNKRIDQFLVNARDERTNARLALTAVDINALLASSGFSNRVWVTFTNASLMGQISIPVESLSGFLNRFGVNFLRGRYLNGAVLLDVRCHSGNLAVNVKDITVNGNTLPAHYMEPIREMNFTEGVATNSVTRQSLQRIQRVAIEKDRLIFEVGSTNLTR